MTAHATEQARPDVLKQRQAWFESHPDLGPRRLVTGDAIHARAEAAQTAPDRGGDDLFALKANRPAMLEAVAAFFADPPKPLDAFETTDGDHGRIEIRRRRVTHCTDWLFGDRAEPGATAMPNLATLACVEARRDQADASNRADNASERAGWSDAFARSVIGQMR